MVVKLGEQTWQLLGKLPVHEMESLVGESLAAEGITTVSGWVTQRLGGFPKAGDTLKVGAFELRVEEMDDTRVERLQLKRIIKDAFHP